MTVQAYEGDGTDGLRAMVAGTLGYGQEGC
jgi:hypothetical protein